MNESWKTVLGYEDYLISNCGRVKTKERPIRYVHAVTKKEHFRVTQERHLKKFKTVQGYEFVQLYKDKVSKNFTIHRLVALNFISNEQNLCVVNHIDGNKLNNRIDNLEWCTDQYNHEHAKSSGLLAKGSTVGTSKLNDKCVIAIRKLGDIGWSQSEISELFEISRPNISHILNNKTWVHLTGQELNIEL